MSHWWATHSILYMISTNRTIGAVLEDWLSCADGCHGRIRWHPLSRNLTLALLNPWPLPCFRANCYITHANLLRFDSEWKSDMQTLTLVSADRLCWSSIETRCDLMVALVFVYVDMCVNTYASLHICFSVRLSAMLCGVWCCHAQRQESHFTAFEGEDSTALDVSDCLRR